MANLAEAVDATEADWIISADLSDTIDYLTVESEIVKITANFPAQPDPQTRIMQAPRIRVERAAGGTTAASHADTTALTPLIPPAAAGGGGGAIAVDNTVDPPAEVTTLIAPGADLSTPGEADLSTAEGVQRVRLLGPFDIPFGIPDESTWPDVYHFGETLAAGTLVTKLLVLPTVQWISAEADVYLDLGIGVPGDINNTGNSLFRLVVRIGGVPQGVSTLPWTGTKTFRNALTSPTEVMVDQPGIFVAAGQMLAYLSHPCSAGSARVYVHVEEPSV